MDYKNLIHTIVDSFVSNPESILIREINDETKNSDLTFLICAPSEDIARLIGKKGCIANSIRDIVSIAGKLEGKKVFIKFESLKAKIKRMESNLLPFLCLIYGRIFISL